MQGFMILAIIGIEKDTLNSILLDVKVEGRTNERMKS